MGNCLICEETRTEGWNIYCNSCMRKDPNFFIRQQEKARMERFVTRVRDQVRLLKERSRG